ncbi:MAG TPA: hypothetical protein VKV37_23610 [Ktedonobacteraceae bacterium]|jgi:hypothetical protein|nr:hypothetical protein [Ktedonobacteraceae bacterium]
MSQEYNETNKRARRAARAQRNRPVLVTSKDSATSERPVEELSPVDNSAGEETPPLLETSMAELEQSAYVEPAPRARRFPRFFSSQDKPAQQTISEEEIARARIARATRGRQGNRTVQASAASETAQAGTRTEGMPARPAASGRTPVRQPSPFKTRYILGFAIYLLAANFIGVYETEFLRSIHADSVLAQFPLFGGMAVIRSSTLLFLATLILILILLVKFDLIPRNLGSMMAPPPSNRSGQGRSGGSDGGGRVRNVPPPMRQGVRGADDDLYQQYRASQRRERRK